MDELELSGKRHISTRRAGKEHGYHSDYIGQLIRGKKVAGQKVGRSWYVDEESLRVYLGKNPTPEVLSTKSSVLLSEPSNTAGLGRPDFAQEPPASIEIPTQEEVKEIVSEKKEILPPVAEEPRKIAVHTQVSAPDKKPTIEKIGGLTYLSDDEPLLPPVRTRATDELRSYEGEEETNNDAYEEEDVAPQAPTTLRRVILVGVLALVVAGLSFGASAFTASTIELREGNTASLYYSVWVR